MSGIDSAAILAEVRTNHARLNACDRHDFQPLDAATGGPLLALTRRYQCAHCLGHVDGFTKLWYERGLAHGRITPA